MSKLPHYDKGEADWPKAWVLPDQDEATADLFDKMAWIADDLTLREAVHVWDNVGRLPGTFEGVQGGLISAHARFVVGSGFCNSDLEKAADGFRRAWLGMARQAAMLQREE